MQAAGRGRTQPSSGNRDSSSSLVHQLVKEVAVVHWPNGTACTARPNEIRHLRPRVTGCHRPTLRSAFKVEGNEGGPMKQAVAVGLALAVGIGALTLFAEDAQATRPCPPIDRDGAMVRVATNRVDCEVGRSVVEGFYERLDAGKVKSQFTRVEGFRCAGGLAFSELFCNRGSSRWVFASSRPEDDPATWKPPSKPRPVKLTAGQAANDMRDALAQRFGGSWTAGYARRVHCFKRVARGRVRCTMSWILGDTSFFGRGVIWLSYEGGATSWNYSYRIAQLNEYCAYVLHRPRKQCTRIHVVR